MVGRDQPSRKELGGGDLEQLLVQAAARGVLQLCVCICHLLSRGDICFLAPHVTTHQSTQASWKALTCDLCVIKGPEGLMRTLTR